MKKIPEKYELDQNEIEDAITDWLNNHHSIVGDGCDDFKITFKRELRTAPLPKEAPIGGMSDPIEEYYYSAVAEKL